jgi:hypothetical protein
MLMALPEFNVASTISGNSPETRMLPEAAVGSTFNRGQCVVINDAGKVEEAATTGLVYGVAAEDATGVEDNEVAIWVLNDDTIFIAEADADVALTDRYITCDFVIVSTVHLVDVGASTDDTFRVVKVETPATGEKTLYVTGGPGSMAISADPSFPAAST